MTEKTEEVLPIPLDALVLIKVDTVDDGRPSGSIIAIPDAVKARHEDARTTGQLVAIGEKAEEYYTTMQTRPKVGDKVLFKRYSGAEYRTTEGDVLYRVMNYDDLWSILPSNYTAGVKQSV